jgi:TonB family protein
MGLAEYADHCARVIETRANAPGEAATRSGREGSATIRLLVKPSGYAVVETLKSSGDPRVDSALLTLARRGEPFGALPNSALSATYPLTLELALVPTATGSKLTVAKAKD